MLIDRLIDFWEGLTFWRLVAYFWPFFLIDMLRYLVLDLVVITSYRIKRRRERPRYHSARERLYREWPLVSVIVPGKNEGRHMTRLANSMLHQSYKNLELIVVDDGSDDDTPIICRRLEREGRITLFIRNRVRGGKASAANTALRFSRGRFILHIDADSHLHHDSIEKILLPFYLDSNVGAVGGDVRVANVIGSMATRLQAIEYMKAISVGRTIASELGILRIISGAHGAFRKDVIEQIGGWDIGPGLDGDITMKVRKLGYRVVHEPHAVCYTNVPENFRNLARQRFRWDRSLIRFRVRRHRDVLLPSSSFNLSNFLASSENIFFKLLLNLKWWVYIAQVILFLPEHLPLIFLVNYLLYTTANFLQFFVAYNLISSTLRKHDYMLAQYLPLMPLYTGFYLRIVRTYAYLMEFLHKVSYLDAWNPWKVSKIAQREDL